MNEVDLMDVTDVSVGDKYVVARKSDGTVWGWGQNAHTFFNPEPEQFALDKSVRRIAALNNYFVVMYDDGTLDGFGDTSDFVKGIPDISTVPGSVKDIKSIVDWRGPSRWDQYIVILTEDGSVYTWGSSFNGEAEIGANTFVNGLISVVNDAGDGLTDIKDVFISGQNGIAIDNAGKLTIWGDDSSEFNLEYLGFSSVIAADISKNNRIVIVPLESPAIYTNKVYRGGESSGWEEYHFEEATPVAVSAGRSHHIVLMSDGTTYRVDDNGVLAEYPSVPGTVVQVFAGDDWSVALTSDGTLHWLTIIEL